MILQLRRACIELLLKDDLGLDLVDLSREEIDGLKALRSLMKEKGDYYDLLNYTERRGWDTDFNSILFAIRSSLREMSEPGVLVPFRCSRMRRLYKVGETLCSSCPSRLDDGIVESVDVIEEPAEIEAVRIEPVINKTEEKEAEDSLFDDGYDVDNTPQEIIAAFGDRAREVYNYIQFAKSEIRVKALTEIRSRRGAIYEKRKYGMFSTTYKNEKEGGEGRRDPRFTDTGNAIRFTARYEEIVKWVFQWDEWALWDGTRWARDDRGAILEFSTDIAHEIEMEGEQLLEESENAINDDEKRNMFRKGLDLVENGQKLENLPRQLTMLARAKPMVAFSAGSIDGSEGFDQEPLLVNCENGIVDLKNLTLLPHDPAKACMRKVKAKFNLEAACDIWERVVSQIMCHREDLIDFIQRVLGYCITGLCPAEMGREFFIFHGEGSNGKNVISNIMMYVLGTGKYLGYAGSAKSQLIMERRNDDGPNPVLMKNVGRRVVFVSESKATRVLDEEEIKRLVGDRIISGRDLYEKDQDVLSTFKIILNCNRKPRIRSNDYALWSRIFLTPFDAKFIDPNDPKSPAVDNKKIFAKTEEKELREELLTQADGIFTWLCVGAHDYVKNGLRPPSIVLEKTQEYEEESRTFDQFVKQMIVYDLGSKVKKADLYAKYSMWCKEEGVQEENKRQCGARLKSGEIKMENGKTIAVGEDSGRRNFTNISMRREFDESQDQIPITAEKREIRQDKLSKFVEQTLPEPVQDPLPSEDSYVREPYDWESAEMDKDDEELLFIQLQSSEKRASAVLDLVVRLTGKGGRRPSYDEVWEVARKGMIKRDIFDSIISKLRAEGKLCVDINNMMSKAE